MEIHSGVPVSPGIAIGEVFVVESDVGYVPERRIEPAEAEHEVERLGRAVEQALNDLAELHRHAGLESSIASIFASHDMVLQDPTLRSAMEAAVRERLVAAENAVATVFDELVERFERLGNEYFAQRASDMRDIERRLLRALVGERSRAMEARERGVVVAAHDLSPSETALLDRRRTLGFLTDVGGPTSHTAIIARGIGMPAVVGLGNITSKLFDGQLVIVDGNKGQVIVDPDQVQLERYQRIAQGYERYRSGLSKVRDFPAETRDGHLIRLMGNIEQPHEIDAVLAAGGDGVGLFRTEFLYDPNRPAPTEEEQFDVYVAALHKLGGRPLTIRTFDFGMDKLTPDGKADLDPNPALGSRSLRLCLERPDILVPQLRAILRASAHGNVRVLFPMVSSPSELTRAKAMLDKARVSLRTDGVYVSESLPVGVMIEIPSAAIVADLLIDEVQFFSIGSNDLIQYALAVDRVNERVAHLYQPVHPAILRLVRQVVQVAADRGKPVSLCGEMAGDMLYTVLLVGMGLRDLSLSPRGIPEIKKAIRSITVEQSREAAAWCTAARSAREVQARLREIMSDLLPAVF